MTALIISLCSFLVGLAAIIIAPLIQSPVLSSIGIAILAFGLLPSISLIVPLNQIHASVIDQAYRWEPLRNTVQAISASYAILLVIVITGFSFPPSVFGVDFLSAIIAIIIGVALAGFRPGFKATTATLLIGVGAWVVVSRALPNATNNLTPNAGDFENRIIDFLIPTQQVQLTVSALRGRDGESFFTPSGEAKVWCVVDDRELAGWRCYNRNRPDPLTGQTLIPFSKSVRDEALNRLTSADGSQQKSLSSSDATDRPGPRGSSAKILSNSRPNDDFSAYSVADMVNYVNQKRLHCEERGEGAEANIKSFYSLTARYNHLAEREQIVPVQAEMRSVERVLRRVASRIAGLLPECGPPPP